MSQEYWAYLNKPRKIFWNAISHEDRHVAIYNIEKTILKYGFIVDHHMFSDVEMSFTIEIKGNKIKKLYYKLRRHIRIFDPIYQASYDEQDCMLYLHLCFSKSKGKLKIDIPSVPG
jgi:hypothetical protein